MGCICSNNKANNISIEYSIALKIPHGTKYMVIENDKIIVKDNINNWINLCFQNKKYSNYINYNDEHYDKIKSINGHCKGCIAWNKNEIVWLVHSVPKFMIHFKNYIIEPNNINDSELIYGQSFIFVSGIPIEKLDSILDHISIMKPYIDENYSNFSIDITETKNKKNNDINKLCLNKSIEHIAKSPKNNIDIFSNYIQPTCKGKLKCETWIRGHKCDNSNNIIDNKTIKYENISYNSSQDHSKYGCSDDTVYIGDLNRMKTQFHRGGGGFIIKNKKLAKCISSIME
jgi:hypothetical protein